MNATITLLVLMLSLVLDAPAQSVKKLERKAKKTYNRGAYGMALYYSQAILKIDRDHTKALRWSQRASKKLRLINPPSDLPSRFAYSVPAVAPKTNVQRNPGTEEEVFFTIIVSTFNGMDSSTLDATYVGITNDGFGEGHFIQNGKLDNKAVFRIPKKEFYTVSGVKNGFTSGSATITPMAVSAGDTLRCDLYLEPSWGLPIELYFDHEMPEIVSPFDTVASLSYKDAWLKYLYRIDEYIDSNMVVGESTGKSQSEVGLFFANHVDANFQKLETMCGLLEKSLTLGNKVTLSLQSIRSDSEKGGSSLDNRRLECAEQYFSNYKNGIFQSALKSGNLIILRLPTVSTPGSKNPFSLSTAKNRKVIIRKEEELKRMK